MKIFEAREGRRIARGRADAGRQAFHRPETSESDPFRQGLGTAVAKPATAGTKASQPEVITTSV